MVDPVREGDESDDIRKLLSAIRERIGVGLVTLLIFSVVLAIAGFVASFDGRRKMAAFESDSRTAIATIADKSVRSVDQAYWTKTFTARGDDQIYQFNVCFTTQDKGYHCGTVGVPGATYNGLRVGSPLKITYASSHPDWFYAGDDVPDAPEFYIFTRMFQYSAIAGLLLIILIGVMVFWPHGDAVAERPANGSQFGDVAHRFRQQHRFGRRR